MSHSVFTQARRQISRSWKAATVVAVTSTLIAVSGTAAMADTLPAGPSTTGLTGLRPSATRLSWRLSDKIQASVDVATGNLNIDASLRTIPGANATVPLTLTYNSRATVSGDNFMGSADSVGWTYGLAGAGSLSLQSNGTTIDFTTADGTIWPFAKVSGSTTAYTAPGGIKAVLVKTSSGWTLTYLETSQVVTFDGAGRPVSVADRNSNAATMDWTANTLTGSAGTVDARTAFFTYDATQRQETLFQKISGAQSRPEVVMYDSSGRIAEWTYPDGGYTLVTYNTAGQMASFANEGDYKLAFTYDSSGRVTQVDRSDLENASFPVSSTRLTYPSSTQTLVAGPDTSLSSTVASVPHVTYAINSTTKLVSQATDEMGRVRAATYNANFDALTSTTGTGTSASTVTNTYNGNGGLSLTNSAVTAGAASSATYGTAANSKFLPATTKDDAGNTSTYGYDTSGNQNTMQTAGVAAQASVTYNSSDGTVATATLPGNVAAGSTPANRTQYTYNANHQLTSITPVTGSSLGVKRYTYDQYGRLRTANDGAGRISTYSYNDEDRLQSTSFSDSTATVTNDWDAAGNLTQQVSGSGTITNTYDALNELLSTSNSAGGGTISYTYDKAGNRATMTTSKGTTTYTYDASGVLTSLSYPANTAPTQRLNTFATDSNGRRTDEWLGSDGSGASMTFAGHVHTTYNQSGRISNVFAETETSGTKTTTINVDYCYNTGGSGTSCGTATAGDRSKLQWTYDRMSGQTTTYTYDASGRLTQVSQSGGSGANNTYTYAYNANGDRTSSTTADTGGGVTTTRTNVVHPAAVTASQTLTYNAADQITSTGYTYDAAGNLTASPGKTFTYNAAEQMTSATINGTTYSYKYAGASQNALLSVTGNSQTRSYVYGATDAVGNPELEIFTNSAASSPTYIYNDSHTGQPLMTEEKDTDDGALIVYDGIGNPIALLETWASTSQSTAFEPYGLATVSNSSVPDVVAHNPYTFKGGIQDGATGLIKFGQRWYSATTGAWTQQDTLDSPLDPANANRYAFAGDDPINNSDSAGLEVSAKCAAAQAELGVSSGLTALDGVDLVGGALTAETGIGLIEGSIAAIKFSIDAALTVKAIGEVHEQCG